MPNPADPSDRRALLQNALQALDEMQTKLNRVERARTEPIAIVGMGCRFPGGVDSPESYWQLLHDGVDAIREYPEERRAMAIASGIDLDAEAARAAWYGGFLDHLDQFDPQFFGISPREATTMDPQQRLVLEVAWEALERAGIAPDRLSGSSTGVFVGITTNDYLQLVKLGGPTELDVYAATGGALNAAAGRVAYTLGLQGPTMAIDTACSSSLVAIHLACQSLRNGECDMALAGGVNVVLMAEAFICFNRWGMMAPDGRCKAFDSSADGFVRAEGCGIVVLKRLSDAVAAGDNILAVVRGSAVNQDGRSSGLTVPNGPAQQAVLRKALAAAKVDPAHVQYVEAHGTGTTLGDPIEVEAIGAVLGKGRHADQPLFLSSVKTNIGHLESAAGIAGFIKVVLAMQHGQIPPHLHFHERSARIPWPDFPIVVPTELTAWPAHNGKRIAGVSGFGFSGTNAHVVLESAPTRDSAAAALPTANLLTLSAKNETALRALAGRFATQLAAQPELALADICQTSNVGRAHFNHRLALTANSTEQLQSSLAAFAAGQNDVGVYNRAGRLRIAFLFTGQGTQYPGMAAQLDATQPIFRAALDRCAAILQPLLDRPLREILFVTDPALGAAHPLHQTGYTQPALFAIEYALAELWRAWGVTPQALLGHSVGEYVAAVIAGVFSLEDGLKLIAARGRLMQALPAGGAMTALFAPADRVRAAVAPHAAQLAIAAVNGPEHTVISGAAEAVQQVADGFAATGVRVQPLTVSHAFHSPLMAPMLAEFGRVAASVTYHAPQLPLFSNVTGQEIDTEVAAAEYWVRHILAPVQFAPAMDALHSAGYDTFIEIGPHPVLSAMGQACLPDLAGTWASSLRRNRDDRTHMLESLAKLYVAGVAIDWDAFHQGEHGERLELPTYPFQRQRYWVEPVKPRAIASYEQSIDSTIHPLLGRMTRSPAIRETLFETTLGAQQPTYLTDHRLYGTAIFPGAGYLEMALAAAQASDPGGSSQLSLTIREPLVLPETGQRALQLVLAPADHGQATVQILSRASDNVTAFKRETWSTHATGTLQTTADPRPENINLSALAAQHPETLDIAGYYQQLAEIGLNYGPTFCGIREARWRTGSALGRIVLPETIDLTDYQLHPALLDACFQLVGVVLPKTEEAGAEASIYVPVEIAGLRLYERATREVWCHVEVQGDVIAGKPTYAAALQIFDSHGQVIAQIAHLHLRRTDRRALERASDTLPSDWFYELAWRQVPAPTAPVAPTGSWLIYADAHGLGSALAERLRAAGATCVVVTPGASTAMLNAGSWQLDPTDPDAPARLLRDAFISGPPHGAIHLWSLPAAMLTKGDLAELHAQQTLSIASALHLTQALAAQASSPTRLWLVTRGAQSVYGEPAAVQAAALWGFGRVVATEQEQLGSILLDLDPATPDGELEQLLAEIATPDREREIAWRAGARHAARLLRLEAKPTLLPSDQPYELALPSRGTLDALTLRPLTRRAPGAGEIEIAVRATGLNFRDVLNVLGMYPGDPGPPGLECAGIVTGLGAGVTEYQIGDAVVALAPRSFDSYVVTRAALAAPKPSRLSFAEAVTIPSAFLTAAYGLQHLAQLQPGERVLIHAAAGGVGLAAVQLALRAGAEVFATAGSPEKHAFLRAMGVQHIFSSRTLDFADAVLQASAGRGVDVVLNSLADEFITRSLDVLAPGGRFLEIGKRGIWTDDAVAASYPHVRYLPYDLGAILEQQPGMLEAMQRDLLAQFAAGELQPLPLRAFSATAIVDAFRFMAQARHIGKVVVTHRSAEPAIQPDATYMITGGLGGLGLTVAQDLAARGARHLALIGRRPPTNEAAAALAALDQQGVDVRVFAADIANTGDVADTLAAIAATQPPLRGIIHAAGVLEDGALTQQTWARFSRVLAPKVDGAWLLDQQTHGMALDFFVLFSSASALLGAAGQSNYAAANATLDALAQQRRAAGKPALSINWGAWNTVGMAAALDVAAQQRLAARGVGSIAPEAGVRVLARLLEGDAAQVAVLSIDWPTLLAQLPVGAEPPLLSAMALAVTPPSTNQIPALPASLIDLLTQTAAHERRDLLLKHIQEQLIKVLALDPNQQLDPLQGLTDIGMDSLMAVELSNRLRASTGLALPSTLAFEYPTLDALTDYLAAELLGTPADVAVVVEDAQAAADLIDLAQLSEEEAEDILLRELAETGY